MIRLASSGSDRSRLYNMQCNRASGKYPSICVAPYMCASHPHVEVRCLVDDAVSSTLTAPTATRPDAEVIDYKVM